MTAEIAIMNRFGVALAADSAATVTYWQGGKRQTRYLKGANKIFNVSNKYPVGAMIYDAGALQGVPWEVVLKAYRDQRGDKAHDTLSGYADDLFDFILTDGHLFPTKYQEQQVCSALSDSLGRIAFVANGAGRNQKKPLTPTGKRRNFNSLKSHIAGTKFIGGIDHADLIAKCAPFKAQSFAMVAHDADVIAVNGVLSEDEMFDLATEAVFKPDWTTLQQSGVVLTGYGETQYFPQLLHYGCYGVILGTIIKEDADPHEVSIDRNNVSELIPMAISNMVKTFMYGASMSVLDKIGNFMHECMNGFEAELKSQGHLPHNVNIDTISSNFRKKFLNDSVDHMRETHMEPLRTVVGMLSIPELADLAETLISIESLKERVTAPTEYVSGPIDVAVISKSDGFIWLKRKHYFEAPLNPRFFARKGLA